MLSMFALTVSVVIEVAECYSSVRRWCKSRRTDESVVAKVVPVVVVVVKKIKNNKNDT